MNVIAIIPARMGSSRFPGKPMHNISGIPMIGHCVYRIQLAQGLTDTYVATCDKEIADYVESIDGKVVMTSPSHTRATGRSAEAMEKIESKIGQKIDVVIMVQGDEPLILPDINESLFPSLIFLKIEPHLLMRQGLKSLFKKVQKQRV